MRPYLEKPFTKTGWWSGSRWRPWVQAPVSQKKNYLENNGKENTSFIYSSIHAFSCLYWILSMCLGLWEGRRDTKPCPRKAHILML
jgi:hypothetical protein